MLNTAIDSKKKDPVLGLETEAFQLRLVDWFYLLFFTNYSTLFHISLDQAFDICGKLSELVTMF
jgi:hypothetical protein